MSLVKANDNDTPTATPSLANAIAGKKPVLVVLARKQIEQERTKSGQGAVPATDLKDDSPELQQALDRIDLSNTAGMSADEVKALESTTHEQAQKKQDDTIMKTTVASDMIFYAYARRTDHKDFSRYLLNFANAGIAQEWWELVHAEYPDTERNGPQFFSFKGDDLPGKVWGNKKFEHLQTKWFWTRMDDTGGRQQPVIPLQDAKGYVIGYATNTTTAYVGTNIHSSSSATSSESSTAANSSTHTGNAGATTGVVGAGVSVSAELSAILTQQALHLKQVQELIAAQSAQIAAWGQLLSVLLQGGQLTSIQSLQGTEVGANLSQIIASLTISGGISQGTVQSASGLNVGVGGVQTGITGSNTVQNGIGGSGNPGLATGINSGSSIGLGSAINQGASVVSGSQSGSSKQTVSTTTGMVGTVPSVTSGIALPGTASNVGGGGVSGASGSSTSSTTTTTQQIVTAAAQASSAGHAAGYTSGHAAGFAAGLKACQSQSASSSASHGPVVLPGAASGTVATTYPGASIGTGSISNSSSSNQNPGATIHIGGASQHGSTSSGQQGSFGLTTSWDQAKTQFGGQSNNSYGIGTSGSGGSQSGGSYTLSYGAGIGGNSSGATNLSATITAGQGGTVNAGRMTFNNTTFSAAITDVAKRRATWLSQSGDQRPQQEILRSILQSCLNEGRLTLSAGVQSDLSSMIVGGQGGTINAGQMLISGQSFGAFVDKASTMRSQQLAGLGDTRSIREIYTGVFSALLAELEESMNTGCQ